jgi:TPR repeat protein
VDVTAAKIWFVRAAEQGGQGSVEAMIQLGELLESENARGEAAEWYSKAAAKGSVSAVAKLASIDVKNGAVQQASDRIVMGERLEGSGQGANADLTTAMTDLAHLYESKGNAQLAKDWYGKAAARKGAVAMEWVKKQEAAKSKSRIRIEDKVQ